MSELDRELIRVSTRGPAVVLEVAAAHLTAMRGVDQFSALLKQLLRERPESAWIIDFQQVTFMVTPAISALLSMVKELRARDGRLVLAGINRNVRHIFELMRLDEVLGMADDVPAALRMMAEPA